jgi:hypothetical protein
MEADMTSFHCLRLLLLVVASWFVEGGAAIARDFLEPKADLACRADLFAGYIPAFRNGDVLPKEGIFAVNLQPMTNVVYFVRFSDEVPQSYGGIVTFESIASGRYGIVLSREARLSAVQHRPFQPVALEQGKAEPNCSSWAEIVVEGGPLTLQIGNVTAPSIKIAMMRLPD